eukprot:scaffold43655_cov51-Phaeocystis_antarctica.AAC.3
MPQRSRGCSEDDRTPEELATFKRSLMVRSLSSLPPADLPMHRPHLPPRAACPLPGHQSMVRPPEDARAPRRHRPPHG